MLEKIACKFCPNEIVVHAGREHDHICRECRRLSEEERDSKAIFFAGIKSGATYAPSAVSLKLGKPTAQLIPLQVWSLEQNWFTRSQNVSDIMRALEVSATADEGEVVFNLESGSTLKISFNETYAACQYSQANSETPQYAYTTQNSNAQIDHESHLCITCSCCGIASDGIYPSRFHMPKKIGLETVTSILNGTRSRYDVNWLPAPDMRWVDFGVG